MSVNRLTLTKQDRLYGDKRVNALFRDGSSFVCYPFRVIYKETDAVDEPPVRFLVSVSKRKLKHAVDRNRVKRLIREAYRLNIHQLSPAVHKGSAFHVAFIWIPSELLPFEKVNQKMYTSLKRLFEHGEGVMVESDETNNHHDVV